MKTVIDSMKFAGLLLKLTAEPERFVMSGSPTGDHSIARGIYEPDQEMQRVMKHWAGYKHEAGLRYSRVLKKDRFAKADDMAELACALNYRSFNAGNDHHLLDCSFGLSDEWFTVAIKLPMGNVITLAYLGGANGIDINVGKGGDRDLYRQTPIVFGKGPTYYRAEKDQDPTIVCLSGIRDLKRIGESNAI